MAKRIGVSATTLNDEDLLDIGLLNAMQKGKKTDFVPREKIMKTLGKK
ncbi:MAG: hypothetical protein NTX03_04580 [Bacteroidetes bacterium]|nr:hypothetical protein [Bacteroidota bacterium]